MKKGELSITVIVVAAIALLVLVVLAYLVIRAGGNIGTGTSCSGIPGAKCVPIENDNPYSTCMSIQGGTYVPDKHQCPENQVCCVPVGV